jgi:putative ABC transport system substrate-binding protein
MTRRRFVGAALLAAFAPRTAVAQPPRRPVRLGVLLFSDPGSDPNMRAVREALRQLGYIEGRNLVIEYRYAQGHPERFRDIAVDLVRTGPDVILAMGGDVAVEAVAATRTIPTVISVSNDPVRTKLVASLARPGGNVTGVTFLAAELAAKRLQLLREAAPGISRVAVVWNPNHADDEFREIEAAGRSLGVEVLSVEVLDASQLPRAFDTLAAWKPQALMPVSSRLIVLQRPQIIAFAARQRLPLAGGWGLWAETGGLMSYGPNLDAMFRRAVGYVDRIVKGAKPGELPVEQPTKFELVVNLKAASALGLTLPPALLAQADRVLP